MSKLSTCTIIESGDHRRVGWVRRRDGCIDDPNDEQDKQDQTKTDQGSPEPGAPLPFGILCPFLLLFRKEAFNRGVAKAVDVGKACLEIPKLPNQCDNCVRSYFCCQAFVLRVSVLRTCNRLPILLARFTGTARSVPKPTPWPPALPPCWSLLLAKTSQASGTSLILLRGLRKVSCWLGALKGSRRSWLVSVESFLLWCLGDVNWDEAKELFWLFCIWSLSLLWRLKELSSRSASSWSS